MQSSPAISIEQDSSAITISRDSSGICLNIMRKVDKWRRMVQRIAQFFRYIKIPILRSRFINLMDHLSVDDFDVEELKKYETRRVQEDLAFLDDIRCYREVFQTFSSFGFVWQDKEFQLAKLKANYIYDRYMFTPEVIAKTNIPIDTIQSITNRMNSPRIVSSLMYLNVFNDAEKFIIEKLLMIYIRMDLNDFSASRERQSAPMINRNKGNRIPDESVPPSDRLKETNLAEKSTPGRSDRKANMNASYDETIIPNWTYSIGAGLVYNPIREKTLKMTNRKAQKTTKPIESTVNSLMKLDENIPNEVNQFVSTLSKTTSAKSTRFSTRLNRHMSLDTIRIPPTNKRLSKSNDLSSSPYSQHDHIFNTDIFNPRRMSQTIFICKVHSRSDRPMLKSQSPYRMAFHLAATHISPRTNPSCH